MRFLVIIGSNSVVKAATRSMEKKQKFTAAALRKLVESHCNCMTDSFAPPMLEREMEKSGSEVGGCLE